MRNPYSDRLQSVLQGPGTPSPAYINEMRMQDALRMLENEPDVSIGLIADAVGFTPANFREQFKKEYGMTPTEYRQNL